MLAPSSLKSRARPTQAMKLAIKMVFEAAALGLSLKIEKCSFFPRHAMKALGTIVDLRSFRFSVSSSRAKKIRSTMKKLGDAIAVNCQAVPAKLVASFIGLIWSISTCCHRAASVMVRAITATLSDGLKCKISAEHLSLAVIINRFWSGTVKWTTAANRQLQFWSGVAFEKLSAPISADVLGLSIEQAFWYPRRFNHHAVSFLFQDASATASGGGVLHMVNGALSPSPELFLAIFSPSQSQFSSTLRELLGILWCIKSTRDETKPRIVFICDNWQSCRAVLRGSRVPEIQEVAECIFFWCLRNNRICWPIWVPRTHLLIQEADRRSRLRIPHDDRSPLSVVSTANDLATHLWGQELSFDQAASHRSAISIRGRTLPFNAVCMQPGAAGIDMFRCLHSWANNVNYVFPPSPVLGRLLTFLPTTRSRCILATPLPIGYSWWSYALQPRAKGLLKRLDVDGFALFAFDFS